MNKIDVGLIVSAGKQKRFNSDIPKALVSIDGNCLLDINISILEKVCNKVYVVCSVDNEKYFSDDKYNKIVIESGLGSGDAIYKSLISLNLKEGSIIISWGDSLLNEDLCYEILSKKNYSTCIIPCVYESKPYVELIQRGCHLRVLFSKYNDKISPGYHDMSVFLCSIESLFTSLVDFVNKFFDSNSKTYKHKHGNEFEFLDIFNDTDMVASILEIDDSFKSYSFNSLSELETIIRRLHNEDKTD